MPNYRCLSVLFRTLQITAPCAIQLPFKFCSVLTVPFRQASQNSAQTSTKLTAWKGTKRNLFEVTEVTNERATERIKNWSSPFPLKFLTVLPTMMRKCFRWCLSVCRLQTAWTGNRAHAYCSFPGAACTAFTVSNHRRPGGGGQNTSLFLLGVFYLFFLSTTVNRI